MKVPIKIVLGRLEFNVTVKIKYDSKVSHKCNIDLTVFNDSRGSGRVALMRNFTILQTSNARNFLQ